MEIIRQIYNTNSPLHWIVMGVLVGYLIGKFIYFLKEKFTIEVVKPKKTYELDEVKLQYIKKFYFQQGIIMVEKIDANNLRIFYQDGKVIKTWHPMFLKFFDFLDEGDVICLEDYLEDKRGE